MWLSYLWDGWHSSIIQHGIYDVHVGLHVVPVDDEQASQERAGILVAEGHLSRHKLREQDSKAAKQQTTVTPARSTRLSLHLYTSIFSV